MPMAPLARVMSRADERLVDSGGDEVAAGVGVVKGTSVMVVGKCPPRENVVRWRRSWP